MLRLEYTRSYFFLLCVGFDPAQSFLRGVISMVFIPNPFKSKAENCKSGLRDRQPGMQMAALFGDPTARAVINLVVTHNCAAAIAVNQPYATIFQGADAYLQLDIANGIGAGLRLANLSQMMRSGQLAANNVIVPLATYGALPADIDRVKAAKWICFASNTLGGGNQAGVATVLNLIHQNNLRLDSIVNLRLINTAINSIGGGGPAPAYRGIALPPSRIPSSPLGAWLLQESLTFIGNYAANIGQPAGPASWLDLGLYLLGATIRSHGFTDGNGRTARALYASCLLRGGVAFVAPTNGYEQTLHQL